MQAKTNQAGARVQPEKTEPSQAMIIGRTKLTPGSSLHRLDQVMHTSFFKTNQTDARVQPAKAEPSQVLEINDTRAQSAKPEPSHIYPAK